MSKQFGKTDTEFDKFFHFLENNFIKIVVGILIFGLISALAGAFFITTVAEKIFS